MVYEYMSLMDIPEEARFNILEIGCGAGGTLLALKYVFRNADLYGVERNAKAVEHATGLANISNDSLLSGECQFTEGFFDYILLPI